MLNRIFIYLSKKRYLLVFSCLSLVLVLASCSSELISPNGLFKAVKVRENDSTHYQVIEVSSGHVILTTRAQYDTPNDVKEGGFSADSKQFAAVYHYGHAGTYTWIGVWSTETGEFLYRVRESGWVTDVDRVFERPTLTATLPATPSTPAMTFTSTPTPTSLPVAPTPTPKLTIFPSQPFMKGVVYTSWKSGEYSDSQSDTALSQVIKPLGVNWVSLVVTCYQDTISSVQIQCKTDSLTPTETDLTHTIQYIHSLGMQVMLKPHIDLSSDPMHWRGQIGFGSDGEAWQVWFDSYEDFITYYADLAQREQVDYLVVGTELKGTSHRSNEWREVIRTVRQAYNGPIVYAANWDEYDGIAWWDAVDAIGIDAYYPLALNNEPTLAQLIAVWEPIALELGALAEDWERPIIFTEIGYRSLDGTNQAPSNYQTSGTIDVQEQADCYQAVFDALVGKTWWQGVFWWNWTTDPAQGGFADDGYTANNKPAENVLRLEYGAPSRPIPTPAPTLSPTPASEPTSIVEWAFTSSDGRYGVRLIFNSGVHYQVFEIQTGHLTLTTRAQHDTANDVKGGGFSPDNGRFAAVYHYGHEGNYTWIGVWSTETGQFLYSVRRSGWTSDLSGVFDEQP